MHQLVSGLTVDKNKYYQLLDWKDKHIHICNAWLFDRSIANINSIKTHEVFNELLSFAGIN